MEFYVLINNVKHGPFTIEQLSNKNITPNTLVWSAGFSGWIPARQVEQLVELLASLPPEPPIKLLMPKTWMVESILVTVFCCLPFGIVGIINASKVTTMFAQGDYEEAQIASDNAKKWTIIGVIVGIITGVISFAIGLLGGLHTYS